MGGFGSGNYYRYKKTNLDDARVLDISRMVKTGAILQSGHTCGAWIWTDKSTGEEVSRIGYEANTTQLSCPFLRLQYTFTSSGKKLDYKVPLSITRPHYGGQRFWFICPVKGKRASKLYLPYGGDMFASRHAYRLLYGSQTESHYDRALRKKWKLLDKLDDRFDFPVRPKGMHETTYNSIVKEYLRQDFICDTLFINKCANFGINIDALGKL